MWIYHFLVASLFIICACGKSQNTKPDPQILDVIKGCWTGSILQNGVEHETFIVNFTVDLDSNLIISTTIELDPRSRIWRNNQIVKINGDQIEWENHKGRIDLYEREIRVKTTGNQKPITWVYRRTAHLDLLLKNIEKRNRNTYRYRIPKQLNNSWNCQHAGEAGMNPLVLEKLVEEINIGSFADIHNILIVKNGSLIFEEYFGNSGELLTDQVQDFFRLKPHSLSSTTKCIVSALIGILIDQKHTESVDTKINQFFPEFAETFSEAKKEITLADLLTMRSGLEWDQESYPLWDSRNDTRQLYLVDNIASFILGKNLVANPGERYVYSNGTTTLLGILIEKAAGERAETFATKYLFDPLSIENFIWDYFQ